MDLSSSNIKKFLFFLKLFLYFWKWKPVLFSPSSKIWKKICPEKIPYTLGNGKTKKISYIFSKENFSYISRKGSPKTELSYISGWASKVSKTKIYYTFSKNFINKIFVKAFLGNSFHLFYKLNQTIFLLYKNIQNFLLCWIFFWLLYIFYHILGHY